MNKKFLALMIASMTVLGASSAMAQNSSSLRINGVITASSCDVDTTGLTSVSLPSVTQKDFKGKGSSAGEKHFNISVTECPNTVSAVQVKVSGTADSTDSNLLAIDSGEGMAEGIAIAFGAQGQPLAVNDSVGIPKPVKNGATEFDMTAKYVATSDVVTSGGISASAQINLVYL